jgi:hypothetical protein
MSMTRAKLITAINQTFPRMQCRLGEDFSSSNRGSIWTGEDAGEAADGNSIFNHYAFDVDPQETVWVLGVHRQLLALLQTAGWHAEFHDAGTVFILPGLIQ